MKSLLFKLNQIRQEIDVEKEKGNRYKAFTIARLNAELNPLLIKYGIGVTYNVSNLLITPTSEKTGTDKYGASFVKHNQIVSALCTYSLVDFDSDDVISITTPFIGMNEEGDPAKSQGNAHSYSYKYLWVTLLGLTDEEIDVDSPLSQSKQMTQEQIEISSAPVKDKALSKKLLKGFELGFESCQTLPEVMDLIEDARVKYPEMMIYEQNKLMALIKIVKEQWNIGDK